MPPSVVIDHYTSGDVESRVSVALSAAGLEAPDLDPAVVRKALLALDQLHPRGVAGTDALAARAALMPGMQLLDMAGGIGGPARRLADRQGVTVTMHDLTPAFCRLCDRLTALAGLTGQVQAVCADVCRTAFEDKSFDRIWIQYALMNVPDKAAAFAEAFRLLRPGGFMVACDLVAGNGVALDFPVPWGDATTTHLIEAEAFSALVTSAGFRLDDLQDETDITLDWWKAVQKRTPGKPGPLGPAVIFGPDAGMRVANLMRNLGDGRVREIALIAGKPG